MDFTTCPLCRVTNAYHPDEPPGLLKEFDYRNRCQAGALNGHKGSGGKGYWLRTLDGQLQTWRRPARSNKICGFPLTDENGNLITPLPFEVYKVLTSYTYNVKQMKRVVWENHRLVVSGNPPLTASAALRMMARR